LIRQKKFPSDNLKSSKESFDCIIIGAGLAGLTAARYLKTANLNTLIIESDSQLGGRVKSTQIDGFTLDHGFQVINPTYDEIRRLDVLKMLDFHSVSAGFYDISRHKEFSIHKILKADYGSVFEKFAFLKFLLSNQKDSVLNESIKSFPLLYENLLSPFFAGVFLTEPKQVANAINQQVVKSFVTSYVKGKLPGLPSGGVSRFSMELSKSAGPILLNERVMKIDSNLQKVKTNNGSYSFKNLIVATDFNQAKRFFPKLPAIKFNSSATYYFSGPKISNKLLAVNGRNGLINSGVISNFNPNYAPTNRSLLSASFNSDKSIPIKNLQSDLAKIWQLSSKELEFISVFKITNSLPRFTKNILVSSNKVGLNIFLAGDYLAAPSQQGAMKSGRLAAAAVLARTI
jgi:protoporphyrinogen oxidase